MNSFIKFLLFALCATPVLFVIAVKRSANQPPPTLQDGQFPPCSSKPNCVSSETDVNNEQFIAPIQFGGNSLSLVAQSIKELGGVIHSVDDHLIIALFESALFGFVDDVMLQLNTDTKLLQVRSSSRMGHSDLNVNRERIEALRKLIVSAESAD